MKTKKVKKLSASSVVGAVIAEENKKTKGKGKAGKSGGMFESVVHALKQMNFKCYKNSRYEELAAKEQLPERYIICGVPYDNLLKQKAEEYGIPRKQGTPKTEFVIVANNANSTPQFPVNGEPLKIRIECKWQAVAGTTQAKLLFSVIDLQYGAPEDNIILLMDGNGFDEAMHAFIQEVCEDGLTWKRAPKVQPKNIVKMRLQDFITWANAAFV